MSDIEKRVAKLEAADRDTATVLRLIGETVAKMVRPEHGPAAEAFAAAVANSEALLEKKGCDCEQCTAGTKH